MPTNESRPPHETPQHWFIRLIESERSWIYKVGGAGALGLYIAFRVFLRGANALSTSEMVATVTMVPAFFMASAGVLCRADAVRRRLRAGGAVGPWSRLLFAAGIWSVLIWVVIVLLIGFPLAIWIGNLTCNRPAG